MKLDFFSTPLDKLEKIILQLSKKAPEDVFIDNVSDNSLTPIVASLNNIFDKLHSEIAARQKRIMLLEKENLKLSDHAKTLAEQKQAISSASYSVEVEKENISAQYEKLSNFISGVTEGIIALDSKRKVIFFNKSAAGIIGFTAEYATGKDISDLITVFDKSTLIPASTFFPTIINSSQGIVFQKQNVKLIGNAKTSFVNITSNVVPTKHEYLCIITLEDVTTDNELQKIKLDFVSMAAHELRTPLTTIRGYLSFLQESKTTDKLGNQEQEYVKRASMSAVRLNELIENLLAISKIEQGKLVIEPEATDITPLLDKIVGEYTTYAEYKKLKLNFTSKPKPLPKVMADNSRIEEVLINLLGNALNYTQAGHIDVDCKADKNFLQIAISDTGIGIPNEMIPQLFTKFFRVQGNVNAGAKGTGLGLYISKTIIDAHHGKIWVESKEGSGSTFFFTLPLA